MKLQNCEFFFTLSQIFCYNAKANELRIQTNNARKGRVSLGRVKKDGIEEDGVSKDRVIEVNGC